MLSQLGLARLGSAQSSSAKLGQAKPSWAAVSCLSHGSVLHLNFCVATSVLSNCIHFCHYLQFWMAQALKEWLRCSRPWALRLNNSLKLQMSSHTLPLTLPPSPFLLHAILLNCIDTQVHCSVPGFALKPWYWAVYSGALQLSHHSCGGQLALRLPSTVYGSCTPALILGGKLKINQLCINHHYSGIRSVYATACQWLPWFKTQVHTPACTHAHLCQWQSLAPALALPAPPPAPVAAVLPPHQYQQPH